jgi:hypothetical protein
MKTFKPPQIKRWPALAAVCCLLFGCASLRTVPGALYLPASQASRVLETLNRRNETLDSFKGIGKVKITTDGRMRSARVLWAGTVPDRLRIDILGLPGYPAASLALVGEWVSFDGHSADQFYTHKIGEDSLKRILSVDISAPDIMELMRGRLPIRPHSKVSLYRRPSEADVVLQLDERFWGVQQRIYLDEALSRVKGFDVYSLTGSLVYRADFDGEQMIDGYQIFRRARVSNDTGDRFELEILRYLANVPVDPAAFVLKPRS